MLGFTERIHRIKERINDLNARFLSSVGNDPISQVKRRMVDAILNQFTKVKLEQLLNFRILRL